MNLSGLKKLLVSLCLIFSLVWVIELKSPTLHLPKEIRVKRWASYPFVQQDRGPAFVTFKYEGSEYYIPISNIAVIYKAKKGK